MKQAALETVEGNAEIYVDVACRALESAAELMANSRDQSIISYGRYISQVSTKLLAIRGCLGYKRNCTPLVPLLPKPEVLTPAPEVEHASP